jgi:hypothetical protein
MSWLRARKSNEKFNVAHATGISYFVLYFHVAFSMLSASNKIEYTGVLHMKKIAAFSLVLAFLNFPDFLNAQSPSLDTTFNPGTGPNATVYAVAEQTNGYIIVGGAFTTFNGTSKNYITRLDTFGNLDSSFVGAGPNHAVMTIGLQANNQVLIGGPFNAFNGVYQGYGIARLRSDGSVDTSFTNSASGSVNQITMQANGTALLVGNFYSFNGLPRNGVALLRACYALLWNKVFNMSMANTSQ